jgi:hypothetical protein
METDRREDHGTRRTVDVLEGKLERLLMQQQQKLRYAMWTFAVALLAAVAAVGTLAAIIYQLNVRNFFGAGTQALLCALATVHQIEEVGPDKVCERFDLWVRYNTNAAEVKDKAGSK